MGGAKKKAAENCDSLPKSKSKRSKTTTTTGDADSANAGGDNNANTATESDNPPERPKTPDSEKKCAICLGQLSNKCYSSSCKHEFCYACLLEWSKIKPECPLCKTSFRSIIHNIRGEQGSEFDVYEVPPPPVQHFSIRVASNPFIEMSRGVDMNLMMLRNRREFRESRPTVPEPVPARDVISISFNYPRRNSSYIQSHGVHSHSSHEDNPFFQDRQRDDYLRYPGYSGAHSRRLPPGALQRRSYYETGRRVLPFHSTLRPGTEFHPSVAYFQSHPEAYSRVYDWLHREISALMMSSRPYERMGYVFEMIVSLLTQYDIRSREFRDRIRVYFGRYAKHFQHEFYHFVLSGMDMNEYDRVAAYTVDSSANAGSSSTVTSSSNAGTRTAPDVVTIDSDDEGDTRDPQRQSAFALAGRAGRRNQAERDGSSNSQLHHYLRHWVALRTQSRHPAFVFSAPRVNDNEGTATSTANPSETSHRTFDLNNLRNSTSSSSSTSNRHEIPVPDLDLLSPRLTPMYNERLARSYRNARLNDLRRRMADLETAQREITVIPDAPVDLSERVGRVLTDDDLPVLTMRARQAAAAAKMMKARKRRSMESNGRAKKFKKTDAAASSKMRLRSAASSSSPTGVADTNNTNEESLSSSSSQLQMQEQRKELPSRSCKRTSYVDLVDVSSSDSELSEIDESFETYLSAVEPPQQQTGFEPSIPISVLPMPSTSSSTGTATIANTVSGSNRGHANDDEVPSTSAAARASLDYFRSRQSHVSPSWSSSRPSLPPVSDISDDDECVFLGMQPVEKKPPLAVITIASSDEEDVSVFKTERTESLDQDNSRGGPRVYDFETFLNDDRAPQTADDDDDDDVQVIQEIPVPQFQVDQSRKEAFIGFQPRAASEETSNVSSLLSSLRALCRNKDKWTSSITSKNTTLQMEGETAEASTSATSSGRKRSRSSESKSKAKHKKKSKKSKKKKKSHGKKGKSHHKAPKPPKKRRTFSSESSSSDESYHVGDVSSQEETEEQTLKMQEERLLNQLREIRYRLAKKDGKSKDNLPSTSTTSSSEVASKKKSKKKFTIPSSSESRGDSDSQDEKNMTGTGMDMKITVNKDTRSSVIVNTIPEPGPSRDCLPKPATEKENESTTTLGLDLRDVLHKRKQAKTHSTTRWESDNENEVSSDMQSNLIHDNFFDSGSDSDNSDFGRIASSPMLLWSDPTSDVEPSFSRGYTTVPTSSIPATTSTNTTGPVASTSGRSRPLVSEYFPRNRSFADNESSNSNVFCTNYAHSPIGFDLDSGVSDTSHHGLYRTEFMNLLPDDLGHDNQTEIDYPRLSSSPKNESDS